MITRFQLFTLPFVLMVLAACGRHEEKNEPVASSGNQTTGATAATASWVPPDGKYERVKVDGITVPMIQVMNNGTVVLIDTDGVKPRTWEEQFKRKGDIAPGTFDLHKTNKNQNDSFEDDAIDRQGLWAIDSKGNITQK